MMYVFVKTLTKYLFLVVHKSSFENVSEKDGIFPSWWPIADVNHSDLENIDKTKESKEDRNHITESVHSKYVNKSIVMMQQIRLCLCNNQVKKQKEQEKWSKQFHMMSETRVGLTLLEVTFNNSI